MEVSRLTWEMVRAAQQTPEDSQEDLTLAVVTGGNNLVPGSQMSRKPKWRGSGVMLEGLPGYYRHPVHVLIVCEAFLMIQNLKLRRRWRFCVRSGTDMKAVTWDIS